MNILKLRTNAGLISALACFVASAVFIGISGCGGGGSAAAVTSGSTTSTGGSTSTGGTATTGTTATTGGTTTGGTTTSGTTTGGTTTGGTTTGGTTTGGTTTGGTTTGGTTTGTTGGTTGSTSGGSTGSISDSDMVATWEVTEMAAGGQSTTCPGSFEVNDGEVICTEDMQFLIKADKSFELFEEGSLTEEGTWKLVGPTTIEFTFVSGLVWTYGLELSGDGATIIATRNDEDLQIEVEETWKKQ